MTDLGDALTALLPRLGGGPLTGLRRLSGGATQEIWQFEAAGVPLILRRAPGGDRVSEQTVGLEVEAALLAAAGAEGVPVPPVVHVLEPGDGAGPRLHHGLRRGRDAGRADRQGTAAGAGARMR